jgi:hypothetical protein
MTAEASSCRRSEGQKDNAPAPDMLLRASRGDDRVQALTVAGRTVKEMPLRMHQTLVPHRKTESPNRTLLIRSILAGRAWTDIVRQAI